MNLSSFQHLSRGAAYIGTTLYLQFVTSSSALAASVGGPISGGGSNTFYAGDTRNAIVKVFNAILNFLALIALIFVVVGGIRILTAGGNEENVSKGRKTIMYALIGLVVIFFAKLLVNLAAGGFQSIT